MRVSVVYYPHDSTDEALAVARAADELGFYGWYLTDSTFRKDPWTLLAAAARETTRVRLGPDAARLMLTDPLVVARALATLDELSGGRVDGIVGLGDARFGGTQTGGDSVRPVPFMRESFEVIRLALSSETVQYGGRYFSYDYTDHPMRARPVQERIPLWYGSGGGPKLMELAGEVADGMHMAPGYTRRTIDYCLGIVAKGAERAGRDYRQLDLAMGPIFVVAEDGDLAREAARVHATFYLPFMVASFFEAINETVHDYATVQAVKDAWLAGDVASAADLVPDDLARLYYVAGTPAECVATLKDNIAGTDINHLTLMIVDNGHVEMILGQGLPGLPTVREQMHMIHDQVMPALW